MAFRLKLLGVLILAVLSLCHGKSASVKVVGTISCAECLNHEQSSQSSSGLSVVLHCKTRNAEMRTLGKGSVDREGKFNIMLSAENIKDKKSIHRCYATLHSAVDASCPVRTAQTATMKIPVSRNNATQTTQIIHHKTVKFSPVTCQSAFFWHFFNFPPLPYFTLPSPDTPDDSPPSPSESITPDLPVQSPSFPPPLPPAFLPPAEPASPPQVPELEQPTPSPVPPILAPEPPLESPVGILTPPIQMVPNPIPRAPPVPQLPPVPAVARKYFKSPTSKSQP